MKNTNTKVLIYREICKTGVGELMFFNKEIAKPPASQLLMREAFAGEEMQASRIFHPRMLQDYNPPSFP